MMDGRIGALTDEEKGKEKEEGRKGKGEMRREKREGKERGVIFWGEGFGFWVWLSANLLAMND